MARNFGRIAHLAGAAAMIALLGACGEEKPAQPQDTSMSLFGAGPMNVPMDGNIDGSMMASGPFADGYRLADEVAPLKAAAPMTASYASEPGRSYRSAPSYDYAPDRPEYYYDDPQPAYYDDAPADDSYGWLALASMLGGVLADSPPDYYFDYGGVEPWVWETGDGYARYAEPLDDGYRYYYYQPGYATPFLVRDPYYSYGYRGDRLAVIYDRQGRVLDGNRAWIQRRAAQDYYLRAGRLYEARRDSRRYGIAAPRWAERRPVFIREQQIWDNARVHRTAWQGWDRRHDRVIESRWQGERAARKFASRRFDDWKQADYRGPAPRFAAEARRDAQVRRAIVQQRQNNREVAAMQNARIRNVERRQADVRQVAARQQQRQNQQLRQVRQEQRTVSAAQHRQAIQQQRVAENRSAQIRRQAELRTARQAQAREQQVQRRVAARANEQRGQVQQRRVEAQQRQATIRAQQAERQQLSKARAQQAQIRQQRAQQQVQRRQQVVQQRQQQVERRQQQAQARQQQVSQQQVSQQRKQQQAMRQQQRQQSQVRQQSQARQQQRVERTQAGRAAASQAQAQRQTMRAAFNDRGNGRPQNRERGQPK